MEAIKIKKTITSDRLPELNDFKGKDVEIIILKNDNENRKNKSNLELINEVRGSCPALMDGMEFQNRIRKEWDWPLNYLLDTNAIIYILKGKTKKILFSNDDDIIIRLLQESS